LTAPNPASPILVALGSDARTLRLVHAGFRMAREQGRPWVVAHIEVPGWETPEEADQARVWLQEAHELGAEVTWVKAATVVAGLLGVARRCAPALLLLGVNRSRGPWDRLESSRAQDLLHRSLDVRIVALPLDASPGRGAQFRGIGDVIGILAAVAVILTVTAIFAAALSVVAGFPAIPGMFALAAGFIAHRWGRRVSVLAALASFAIYGFLFARQGSGFSAENWPHFIFFAAAILGSQLLVDLVGRLRLETRAGRRREAETVLLMLLGRALARCSTVSEVGEVLAQRLHSLFQARAWMLVAGAGDQWLALPAPPEVVPAPPPSVLLPEFAAAARREDPLEPLFVSPCSYVPLAGTGGTEGILQLRRATDDRIPQESWGLLQAFAVQGSLALERIRWVEAAQQARLESETERMRSGLLGAVSHDLRTPLAAIQGAATSLLLPEEALSEATRMDLLHMIREESVRLNRLLSNLLDLTRLESGVIRAHKEWQPIDEVVGSAIGRLERGEDPFPVLVDLPSDLPPVPIDGGLIEQVLLNLLTNAHRYAGGGEILLRAWAGDGSLEMAVRDRGPGVPPEFRQRIFDKFFRMPGLSGDGGVGLGLAICDAILRIHGGRIWVEDDPAGGACFRITLPLEGLPPDLPPDSVKEPAP
jgi:two-component system sensor histidine kinase KdpD